MTSQRRRLLVIDDDADTREVLSEFLAAEGYAVATAANGQDALRVLEREPEPCAILLDLMMPVMDGWQFLDQRKNDGRLSRIPVIVISAFRDRAPHDEIVDVVGKPISFERLLTSLHQHCACPPS